MSMLFLRRPTAETIRAFLMSQARLDLTYSAVGATATNPQLATSWTTPASGWVGGESLRRGKDGSGAVAAVPPRLAGGRSQRQPIKEGQVVVVLARPSACGGSTPAALST